MKTKIYFRLAATLLLSFLLVTQWACKKESEPEPPNNNETFPNVTLLADSSHSPAWSPDGKEIAYIYDYKSLYLMNSDGSNKRELATDIHESPIWSPSGEYILYIGYSPLTWWELIRLDANGDNRTILCGNTTEPRLASWSPDGQKIVFITWNGILAVINVDGTNLYTVTENVHTPETPRWSPDKNTLLFTKGADYNRDMYFINTDGSNLIRLPIDSMYETDVQFPIDGSKVFFKGSHMGKTDIFSVNCDGSGLIKLTKGKDPQLSPDGTKIAFTSSLNGERALYIIASDGSGHQWLTEPAKGLISWSPDGKEIAFCAYNKDYRSAIYSIRLSQ